MSCRKSGGGRLEFESDATRLRWKLEIIGEQEMAKSQLGFVQMLQMGSGSGDGDGEYLNGGFHQALIAGATSAEVRMMIADCCLMMQSLDDFFFVEFFLCVCVWVCLRVCSYGSLLAGRAGYARGCKGWCISPLVASCMTVSSCRSKLPMNKFSRVVEEFLNPVLSEFQNLQRGVTMSSGC